MIDVVGRIDSVIAELTQLRTELTTPPAPKVWSWDARQARVVTDSARLVALVSGEATKAAYCSMTVAVADALTNKPLTVAPTTRPGCSDDHHLAIRDGSVTHDLWRATVAASGVVGWSGDALVPDGVASEPRPGNSNAARFPLLAGLVTPVDIASGAIEHPLVFCFPVGTATSAMGKSLYPADTDFNGPVMKYGQWFRFPPSLDVLALGLAPFETMVTLAGQAHGMFCRDVGSTFSIFGVDAINQGGNASAYGSLLPLTTAGYPYARKLAGIPWAKLEALEPPAN